MLPISDEQISELVTLIFTIVTSIVGFWKNNSFTEEAIIADGIMHDMKYGLASTDTGSDAIVENVGDENG